MDAPLKLAIGLPAYGGQLSAEHAKMWLEVGMTIAVSPERFSLVMIGYEDVCRVDVARCNLVNKAIEAEADWLLMMDADTWVEDGRDLVRMISDADRRDACVVVAPVRRRRVGEGPSELMVYSMRKGALVEELTPFVHHDEDELMIAIDAAATACMAVRLASVRDLDRPWFRFTRTLSEDLDFCQRMRTESRDGSILADFRVCTFHRARAAVLASR